MAWKQPGWVFVSTLGNLSGAGLLDLEMVIADTNTGTVYRIGRHRSWGKRNTHLEDAVNAILAQAKGAPSFTSPLRRDPGRRGSTTRRTSSRLPGVARGTWRVRC